MLASVNDELRLPPRLIAGRLGATYGRTLNGGVAALLRVLLTPLQCIKRPVGSHLGLWYEGTSAHSCRRAFVGGVEKCGTGEHTRQAIFRDAAPLQSARLREHSLSDLIKANRLERADLPAFRKHANSFRRGFDYAREPSHRHGLKATTRISKP